MTVPVRPELCPTAASSLPLRALCPLEKTCQGDQRVVPGCFLCVPFRDLTQHLPPHVVSFFVVVPVTRTRAGMAMSRLRIVLERNHASYAVVWNVRMCHYSPSSHCGACMAAMQAGVGFLGRVASGVSRISACSQRATPPSFPA